MFEFVRILRSIRRHSYSILLSVCVLGTAYAAISLGVRSQALSSGERINRLVGWAPKLLSASAAVGFMTMIVIESLKKWIRSDFHRRAIREWLAIPRTAEAKPLREVPSDEESLRKVASDEAHSKAVLDLLHLIAPRYDQDVLALPNEQLCAQISAAADVVISYPSEHRKLLRALAGSQGAKDVKTLLNLVSGYQPEAESNPPESSSADRKDIAVIDSRNKVSHRIQRNIDAFQVHVSASWSRFLRSQAILIAASLALVSTFAFAGWAEDPLVAIILVLMVSLFGGFFSSVARDLIAAIERLRR